MKNIFITPIIKLDKYKKLITINNLELFNFFFNLGYFCSSSFSEKKKIIEKIIKFNDVLVVSGGGDVSKINNSRENLIRDHFETKLIKLFIKNKKPIIAICRGFQLICSIYGSKLVKLNNHVNLSHQINILKNNALLNSSKIFTNSFHKFGLTNLTKDFLIIGKSKDGYVELAINNKKKILGTMFHPERKNISQKIITNMIKKFLNESINISGRIRS